MGERAIPLRASTRDSRRRSGPDRISVALFSVAAFLAILALLGNQLGRSKTTAAAARRPVLVRRIYRTTVVERVLPPGSVGADGSSVTQSASGASPTPAPAAPSTRAS